MVWLTRARVDELLAEDVPYVDLTCELLGVGAERAVMTYFTREAACVAGCEVVSQMAGALGLETLWLTPAGTLVEAGAELMAVEGRADALHRLWKAGLNVLDHMGAVATKTRAMVDAVHAVAPGCEVLTTRKSMPGCKDLLVLATMAGGAWPHRLGLSETVLVFDHHLAFCGGIDAFLERVDELKRKCIEKKLFVEADAAHARVLVEAGVDGIQLDKVGPGELAEVVAGLKALNPQVTVIAAGGIKPSNAAAYAASGVDGLATTSLFSAAPLDMSVRMEPL